MSIFRTFLLGMLLTGCSSKTIPLISEHSAVSELSGLDKCNFNFQCKRINIGFAFCSHIEGGGNDYLLYSTLIGKENIVRLKELVEKEIVEEKARYDEYWANNTDQLQECQPGYRLLPSPVCSNKKCVIK